MSRLRTRAWIITFKAPDKTTNKSPAPSRLRTLIGAQLRVGSIGFGGPLATMAMMRDELVERHALVSAERYFEGLGAVKLLPGPVAVLLSIFLGQEICGPLGGFLSGLCFILPSFLVIFAISIFEKSLGAEILHAPAFLSAMVLVQVVVLAVILYTCLKLLGDAYRRKYAGENRAKVVLSFALVAAVLSFFKVPEIAVLALCAGLGFLFLWQKNRAPPPQVLRIDPLAIFLAFLLAGITVFGTGFMIFPYLQRVLVETRHWLTPKDFLNSVVYGNLTPGPITIASTYMGYKMGGVTGALAATLGIFAGPFVLMLSLGPVLKRFLGKPWVEGLLLGLLPAVAATIALSVRPLARELPWRTPELVTFFTALILCFRKIPAWALLLGGAAVGVLAALGGHALAS